MNISQIDSGIISNIKLDKNYYVLKLEAPSMFKDAQPGQFVHVRTCNCGEPLLRRPFSIHKITPAKAKSSQHKFDLDILYELKGKGTALLSRKQAGEYVNILGPLGKGFDCQDLHTKEKTHILIAGGMGVAPLLFLAHKISQHSKNKIIVLIGAANSHKILCEKDFEDLSCRVHIATEDGSCGFKGMITAFFEKKLLPKANQPISVYACGPKAMLTNLAKICMIKKIPLQVSLEEFMGCGIGACLGCAIETKAGFKRVCHDGPVFCAEDISWKF
ncbi:MAG: dihydroorotate dehydrogenase electron transfer subunit [Candidatus Omnitrophica bacterium]|nr:dihydroorotate dehydrogenase electron transfer subunit [Candidatus Omnitrophota bacterium]MDD5351641.1 dihydroorotate dehydrogenase electron transfer subunit [Candidatus Omnitrophota bacterium]MDD5550851.1 dihydroorotate dehydrogenase electron transfer subunit [Candidatus Omnitrophota bacterium]